MFQAYFAIKCNYNVLSFISLAYCTSFSVKDFPEVSQNALQPKPENSENVTIREMSFVFVSEDAFMP